VVNQEIIKYIRKNLAKGHSLENIRKKLLEVGWKPSDVDEAIKNSRSEVKVSKGENHRRAMKIFLIFSGIVIFFSIFLFTYLFSSTPRAISDLDLSKGFYLELRESDSVDFNLEEEGRILSVGEIGSNYSVIFVGEPTVSLNLGIDEINEIDLTGDGIKDLKFVLKSIEKRRIYLFVQAINKTICVENWECTDWAVCIGSYKGRVCVDNNLCGTFYEVPMQKEVCESFELNCIDQGGEICNSTSICDISAIISLDSADCCLGACE